MGAPKGKTGKSPYLGSCVCLWVSLSEPFPSPLLFSFLIRPLIHLSLGSARCPDSVKISRAGISLTINKATSFGAGSASDTIIPIRSCEPHGNRRYPAVGSGPSQAESLTSVPSILFLCSQHRIRRTTDTLEDIAYRDCDAWRKCDTPTDGTSLLSNVR